MGCGSSQPKTCPSCDPPPSSPEPADPAGVDNEANTQSEEASLSESAEPKSSHRQDEIMLGDCVSTEEKRRACKAIGSGCFLDAEPVLRPPHPCQNQGARCMEEITPVAAHSKGPCMCSCDPQYKKKRQEMETLLHERRNPERTIGETCHESKTNGRGAKRCPDPEPPELPR